MSIETQIDALLEDAMRQKDATLEVAQDALPRAMNHYLDVGLSRRGSWVEHRRLVRPIGARQAVQEQGASRSSRAG